MLAKKGGKMRLLCALLAELAIIASFFAVGYHKTDVAVYLIGMYLILEREGRAK
jgi:hypothetical protein